MSRQFRLMTVLLALFGMLFSQLAVAAYACPARLSVGGAAMTSVSIFNPVAMSDCGHPVSKPSALCEAHCQDAKQSVDRADAPSIAPPLAAGFVLVLLMLTLLQLPRGALQAARLQRATDPPVSIRNCCFRI